MKSWKRLFYYLGINILVTACTMVVILYLWEKAHPVILPTPPPAGVLIPSQSPLAPAAPTLALESPAAPTLTETPFASPIPGPTAAYEVYSVQSGDTLGIIAQKFGVRIEDIMAMNELTDPNLISVGQALRIPTALGYSLTATATARWTYAPPPTATPTETTTPTLTPTPLTPTQPPQMTIVGVIGAGDLDTERVELWLTGGGEISLLNWQIKDENGHVFTFPELTLFGGARVSIYSKAGQGSVTALYWGLEQPVWTSGETVTLLDEQGRVRTTYQVP